jgi:flagellar hook protein FlgE
MSMMGTAVSGMLADTNWLSSISQNVSNSNTTAYKNAETEFSTLVDEAGGAADSLVGVATSLRSLNSLQGAVVGTSTTTDLAIQGEGYFVVTDSSGDYYLTRNGSFVPDANGDLVNSAGYYLMGNSAASGQADSIPTEKVNITASGDLPTASKTGTLSVNLPSTSTAVAAGSAGLPSANPSSQADATYTDETSITAYDDLGGAHTINVYLTNTTVTGSGSDTWEITAFDASTAAKTGGFPYTATDSVTNVPLATGTLTFDPTTGKLTSVTENGATTTSTFSIPVPNGQTLDLNVGGTTQLASLFSVNTNTTDGNPPSSLKGVTVSSDGTLTFQYSDGTSKNAYDIPLANVASEDTLTSFNGNVYQASQNSGSIVYGTAGTAGLGTVVSSSLENSTVDLATELTNMIEAQSAYQANSKVFQAGADLLDILNNLKS